MLSQTCFNLSRDTGLAELSAWALSTYRLRHYYPDLKLVSDTQSHEILIEKLKLPFTASDTFLEDFKEIAPKDIWVLKKIYAYSIHKQPFINIDHDVFIWKSLPDNLLQCNLIAQNIELDFDYYRKGLNRLKKEMPYLPSFVKKNDDKTTISINAGILGGHVGQAFFIEFWEEVKKFISLNKKYLTYKDNRYLNVIVEQYFLYAFAKSKGLDFNCILPQEQSEYKKGLCNFADIPQRSYLHLMGDKNTGIVKEQLLQRLFIESDELYERVVVVHRKLSVKQYQVINLSSNFLRTRQIFDKFERLKTMHDTLFVDAIREKLNINPVLADVFSFEERKNDYCKSIDNVIFKQNWFRNSLMANKVLGLHEKEQLVVEIKYNSNCCRIDTLWNWAESNEFNEKSKMTSYTQNLKKEAFYYEVLIYYFPSQNIFKEHLLDATNILILDNCEKKISINLLINNILSQLIVFQPNIDKILTKTIIWNRIKHFMYMNVIEIVQNV